MAESNSIDFETLAKLESDDKGGPSLREFVEIFLKHSPERLRNMAAAAQARDPEKIIREAHNLKTSCAYVGAKIMTRLCVELEESPESPTWSAIQLLVDRLDTEYTIVRNALLSYLANSGK